MAYPPDPVNTPIPPPTIKRQRSVYITYAEISKSIIIGPVFSTKEAAKKSIAKRNKHWTWVEVPYDDDEFGGYIT